MNQIPLKNQIIQWAKTKEYWFQYTANVLLEGGGVTDELVESAYRLFKEENRLEKGKEHASISFNEIPVVEEANNSSLLLELVDEVQNVNALAENQSVSIHPNLTIIYGENGAGKSGYIRLLNNAFVSRGDTSILPNVFIKDVPRQESSPSCKFSFKLEEESYKLNYPEEGDKAEFYQFSVFDSTSAKVHLEEDNSLDFTPIGFEFFGEMNELYCLLSEKLKAEISSKKIANSFERHFKNENDIQTTVLSLGAETDKKSIAVLANYTEVDEESLQKLITKKEELNAQNISKQIVDLKKNEESLSELISRGQAILDTLSAEKIKVYKEGIIESLPKLKKQVKEEGIEGLKDYEIEDIGSDEWFNLLKGTKAYSEKIAPNEDYPDNQGAKCLFCLQHLTERELLLINSYWNLLESTSKKMLNATNQTIESLKREFAGLAEVKFDETTKLFEYVFSKNPKLSEKWNSALSAAQVNLENLKVNFENKNWDSPVISFDGNLSEEFKETKEQLKAEVENLSKKDPKDELKLLQEQIDYLNDKSLFSKLHEDVAKFVDSYKWAACAEKSLSSLNTRSITMKQGELFEQHITKSYLKNFKKECAVLAAPPVVEIKQRNERASTLRRIEVSGEAASKILSEGEQRAISLADFLTETKLNPSNRGLIFDDPVCSQDHIRKDNIAKRLVEAAKEKQVIIFTHDISFFFSLKVSAEKMGVGHEYTTIRKVHGSTGLIDPNLPWIAQPVQKRVNTLRDRLVILKKVEASGHSDEYFIAAKSWYGLLREGWERAVEERLFKGVIERFSPEVRTLRLRNIDTSPELINEIEQGMSDSSQWVHDLSAGLNPPPPTSEKAYKDLTKLHEFITKCKNS